MWLFKKTFTPPPPSPELPKPWRPMNWNGEREKILTAINDFKPGNSEVAAVNILLFGPQGGGKSSFFNSVDIVFRGRITTRALANSTQTGQSFSLEDKIYKVKRDRPGSFFPFTFTDIAGMHDGIQGIQTDDIIQILKGHINSGYTFNSLKSIAEEDRNYNKNPSLKDQIHCLVAVIPADTVSMMTDEIFRQMKVVRKKARDLGIPQVIILTKVDEVCPLVKDDLQKIYTSKKIEQKMRECHTRLGVPVNCIFPVKNYHEERETNPKNDILILDALQNILNFANDYVEDQID